MDTKKDIVSLSKDAQLNIENPSHIPSKVQADTLFNFMQELNFLITTVKNKMLSPRYCEEDIRYLNIKGLERLAIPMKCFCDINLHKISEHLQWYGYYGIAFSKEWGMKQGIQPIQYINPNSNLCKDFSQAFSSALTIKSKKQTKAMKQMKNFMLHEIMFYKPYSGVMKRNNEETQEKCFTDECEWRFVPDVTVCNFAQVIHNENIFNAGILREMSDSMCGLSEISLKFEYEDIKYIIIKTNEDFIKFTEEIKNIKLTDLQAYELVSKIIVWDNAKGDF